MLIILAAAKQRHSGRNTARLLVRVPKQRAAPVPSKEVVDVDVIDVDEEQDEDERQRQGTQVTSFAIQMWRYSHLLLKLKRQDTFICVFLFVYI
jgi:hypothetical protein